MYELQNEFAATAELRKHRWRLLLLPTHFWGFEAAARASAKRKVVSKTFLRRESFMLKIRMVVMMRKSKRLVLRKVTLGRVEEDL